MPRVYVSIGSNQQREHHVARAVAQLDARFSPVMLSTVYETEAVGFAGDAFFNLVAGFDTDMDLDELLACIRQIEICCGRIRTQQRFGPRTMDIDVLTYGDWVAEDDALDIPRSEILAEAYVLTPLAQIAPHAMHPQLGESYASLRDRLALPQQGMQESDYEPRAYRLGSQR